MVYRIVGKISNGAKNFFLECTFRMQKFELVKNYIMRVLRMRASDHDILAYENKKFQLSG